MTDKQIIIYKKECYNEPHCSLNQVLEQLKAKEQECERLKEERDTWHYQWEKRYEICESLSDDIDKLYEQLDQLKAENEELKRQHQGDKGLITSTGKMNYQLLQEYDKLKTALTEIKEIAEHCIKQDICTTCDNSDKCHIEDEEIPTYDVCKLILQKISECEVE